MGGAVALCLAKKVRSLAWGYAMLMRPNEDCRGDIGVRMRKVLAIPGSWCVCFSAEIGIILRKARFPRLSMFPENEIIVLENSGKKPFSMQRSETFFKRSNIF